MNENGLNSSKDIYQDFQIGNVSDKLNLLGSKFDIQPGMPDWYKSKFTFKEAYNLDGSLTDLYKKCKEYYDTYEKRLENYKNFQRVAGFHNIQANLSRFTPASVFMHKRVNYNGKLYNIDTIVKSSKFINKNIEFKNENSYTIRDPTFESIPQIKKEESPGFIDYSTLKNKINEPLCPKIQYFESYLQEFNGITEKGDGIGFMVLIPFFEYPLKPENITIDPPISVKTNTVKKQTKNPKMVVDTPKIKPILVPAIEQSIPTAQELALMMPEVVSEYDNKNALVKIYDKRDNIQVDKNARDACRSYCLDTKNTNRNRKWFRDNKCVIKNGIIVLKDWQN